MKPTGAALFLCAFLALSAFPPLTRAKPLLFAKQNIKFIAPGRTGLRSRIRLTRDTGVFPGRELRTGLRAQSNPPAKGVS